MEKEKERKKAFVQLEQLLMEREGSQLCGEAVMNLSIRGALLIARKPLSAVLGFIAFDVAANTR